jgi:hypothetical protein
MDYRFLSNHIFYGLYIYKQYILSFLSNHILSRFIRVGLHKCINISYYQRLVSYKGLLSKYHHHKFLVILIAWWFGTMEFYDFPFSWECHYPNWRSHIFQKGRYTTNQMGVFNIKEMRWTSYNNGSLSPFLALRSSRCCTRCCHVWESAYRWLWTLDTELTD